MKIMNAIFTAFSVLFLLINPLSGQDFMQLFYTPTDSGLEIIADNSGDIPVLFFDENNNIEIEEFKEVEKSKSITTSLKSVYARKSILKNNSAMFSLKINKGYNNYFYTIISFSLGKAVSKGKVINDEVLLNKLTPGSYSVVIYNEQETYVQVIEKK